MSDDQPYTPRTESVTLPSERFHSATEAITRDEWTRRHETTYPGSRDE